jgi:hypothetical protein
MPDDILTMYKNAMLSNMALDNRPRGNAFVSPFNMSVDVAGLCPVDL